MQTVARIFGVAITLVLMLGNPATTDAATRARFRAETMLDDPSMRIAAGAQHNCLVKEGGAVMCWGSNFLGQIGDGTLQDHNAPVPVPGITNAVGVAAGQSHSCALLSDGTVRCWGSGKFGQLGNNSIVDKQLAPVVVDGLSGAVAITAGGIHTCALLANGTVRCWGSNRGGQLGDNSFVDRLTPVVVRGLTGVVAITAGDDHTCALLATGDVACWGFNLSGQLGNGDTANRSTPVLVASLTRVVAISAGTRQTCALRVDGTARCWGDNFFGQLGDNSTSERHSPVPVQGLQGAIAISTGFSHTCAVLAGGRAKCWGGNDAGQMGILFISDKKVLTPVFVSSELSNAVAISAGSVHTCALQSDGSAKCWGRDFEGQLGDGGLVSDGIGAVPTPVFGVSGTFTAQDVAAGRDHTCAVRANGTVACWGANDSGQIGDGTTGNTRLTPVNVSNLANVVGIAAGEAHTCAVLASGEARCWGLNSSGQLGDGTVANSPRPVVVRGLSNVIAIAAGGKFGSSHTCALLTDSTVWCWGANGSGQLGTGNTTPSSVPVKVTGMSEAVAIAVGESHSCALTAVGAAFCWGSDGVTTNPVPVIAGVTDVTAIAGGNRHSCELRADGTVWCWGTNFRGNGSPTSTSTPQYINPLFNAVSIAGGFGHSCASLAEGTAWCWGDNGSGQLGNATNTSSTTPVLVQANPLSILGGGTFVRPFRNIVNVTTGRHHSCALTATGGVVCWGDNTFGQLGINSTVAFQKSPASVPSFALNIDPDVVLEHNDRVSTVTVVAACEEGQRLHVEVTLTQGTVAGVGVGSGHCTGGLEDYPVTLPAHGRERFTEGVAEASAAAFIVDHGSVVDTQAWTRQVQIVTR
jgi:alpha-tubulin suppressor-like RCC1 family protein